MRLFRRAARSHASTGLYPSARVLATATVDRQRGRKPRLIHADCRELSGDSETGEQLRASVADTRSSVTLVMPEGGYQLLLVDAPRVEPSELQAAVRWKVRNLIDFHIDDAVIDVFEIPGQNNRPQGQAMMYAVAARAREIREYIDMVEDANLDLQVIDITEMALRNLAAQLEEDVRGVAMLYLDEDHGTITITRQGSLYLSRHLETDIRQLMEDDAAAGEQVALEVQRSLDYYDSHFGQPPVATVRVLPGFPAHQRLLDGLVDSLNVEVAGYSLDEVVDSDAEIPEQHLAEFLIALGGALRQEEISL